MQCDICGREVDKLYKVEVEGTVLNLCDHCKRFGKVIETPKQIRRSLKKLNVKKKNKKEELLEVVRPDYSSVLRAAREKKGLKQEDVAKLLNEKESLIRALETGHHEPSLNLARKLEHFYGIKLVEVISNEENEEKSKRREATTLTIGDVIKIKKK